MVLSPWATSFNLKAALLFCNTKVSPAGRASCNSSTPIFVTIMSLTDEFRYPMWTMPTPAFSINAVGHPSLPYMQHVSVSYDCQATAPCHVSAPSKIAVDEATRLKVEGIHSNVCRMLWTIIDVEVIASVTMLREVYRRSGNDSCTRSCDDQDGVFRLEYAVVPRPFDKSNAFNCMIRCAYTPRCLK